MLKIDILQGFGTVNVLTFFTDACYIESLGHSPTFMVKGDFEC